MKKVWHLVIYGVGVIAFVSALVIATQKPSEADFKRWMEETYQIQCLDFNCDSFQLHKTEGKESIIMQTVHGGYSPGIFIMKVDRTYRNLEDSTYYLKIEVEGFLEKFTTKGETVKNIPKN